MSRTENNILLFSITLCWAASYVFIKSLPSDLSTYAYLTMTCGIAAALLTIVFFKKVKTVKFLTLGKSVILSGLLLLNLIFDKMGIDRLTSSAASVLASSSILIVPVVMIIMRKIPTKNNLLGAVVIMTGIVITSGFKAENIFGLGALFMLLSAAVTSVYTIAADRITKEEDPLLLSVLQMWVTAIMGFVMWFIEEPTTFASLEYTNEMLSSVFILAFFGKAYAYVALMYSQKYSDPINVTIIASTEPIVTLVLAVLIPTAFEEHFTAAAVFGAAVIMVGAIISGTDFLSRKGGEKLEAK
ncbi:DMT family transporter [Huintestinicola sp.]|uniref:DMT family transporter n=1 Tax=Huintestinicola sp. TaxID=2981661 RepID=UPI003D7C3EF5